MKFYMPARLSFQEGITPDFTGLLDDSRKTLFVVSETLIQDRPELLDLLPNGTETYSEAGSNPDIADLQAVPIDGSIRQVVGLGGGSKLDAAKILFARALLEDRYSLREIIEEPALLDAAAEKRSEYKLIQLPTTFGSSSEITKWGTVWDWEDKRKYSVSHDLLYADHALVYPSLSLTAPFDVTAYTGLDTLSHAIESFWNVKSNVLSRQFSLKSIEICLETLPLLLKHLDSVDLRKAMAQASVFAGLAFSQTKTAGAHSLSYPLTLHHKIPHGYACSLTLGAMFDLNLKKLPELASVLELFRAKYGKKDSPFNDCFQTFLEDCKVPNRFTAFEVRVEDIPRLVSESFHPDRINNMHHKLSEKDIRRILMSVL